MVEKSIPSRWPTLVIIFILFFFMFKGEQLDGNELLLVERVITFLVCTGLLAIPRTWWNPARIILATVAVSFLMVISLLLHNNQIIIYMMIILTIPASYVFKYSAYFYYLSAVLIEVFLLLTFFGHYNIPELLPFLILYVSLALSIRARANRLEANRLSQLHLKELEKAHKELQQSAVATMQHAVLDERTRIAREIHDAVGHSLTSLIVQLQALRYMIEADQAQAKQAVEEMITVARQGLTDIRVSVHALADDHSALGITPLQALVSKVNATTHLDCSFTANNQAGDIPIETAAVLFKVLQEAITNILKHSQATKVDVKVSVSKKECMLSIKDNGLFKETDQLLEGFGLRSMRERLQEIAGTIEFKTEQPSGLSITAKIPILSEHQAKETNLDI